MAIFEFTTKTNSSVLEIDGGNQIPIKGYYVPVVLMPDNIKIGFRPLNTIEGLTQLSTININVDTIRIDSVIFTGSTAKDLYDSLESLFFLDESGSGSTTRLASSRNSNISADGKSGRLDPSGLAGWYFENEYQGEKVNWYYVYNQNQDNVMTLKTLTSMYAVVTIYKEREFHFSVYTKRENDGQ